jgi:hypothetical protein
MVRLSNPHPLFSNWQGVAGSIGWGLVMVIILAIQTRDWIVRIRRYESWESLDVGSGPTS